MALMVKCKNCGTEFSSPVQMDEASFANTTLTGNSYQCPSCGQSSIYDKPDHFFK